MRRVCYEVAMSLDGFIAGPQGEADWIVMDPDIDFGEIFQRFDTFLMGRRTYEATLKMGGGGGSSKGFKTVVVSRTLKPADHPKVTIVSDPGPAVQEMRRADGKDIWLFGGGDLFRSLLALGLVDSVGVGVIPVVLGAGVRFVPDPATSARLKLTSHRVYPKSGIVGLEYDVVGPLSQTTKSRSARKDQPTQRRKRN